MREKTATNYPKITSKRDIDGYGTDESDDKFQGNDDIKKRKLKEFKKILKRKDGNIQVEGRLSLEFDINVISLDEEAEAIDQQVISENRKNIKKSCGVIFPDSNFRTCWDLISFLFIIYQSILIPFRISFEEDAKGGFFYFETIIDCFFISEIFITFNTGKKHLHLSINLANLKVWLEVKCSTTLKLILIRFSLFEYFSSIFNLVY